MLRLFSRFVGYWFVAAALVAAVVDGAKSIAASQVALTPLSESWAALSAIGVAPAEPSGPVAPADWPLQGAVDWLAAAPTAAVLAVLGVLFLMAGRKRRRHLIGREYPA